MHKIPVGRPKKFNNVEDMVEQMQKYFDECEASIAGYTDDGLTIYRKPPTVTGLALALNTTRDLLCDYEKDPEFSDAIKIAKTIVENFAENRLYGKNVTGAIFALKNFGWKDKAEEEKKDQVINIHLNKDGS